MVNIASLLSFQGGITVPAYAASNDQSPMEIGIGIAKRPGEGGLLTQSRAGKSKKFPPVYRL
jgi:hypothetical protein